MEDTNNPTTLETTPAPAPTAPVISARTQADGQLVFKLPDGSEVLLPNPRSR